MIFGSRADRSAIVSFAVNYLTPGTIEGTHVLRLQVNLLPQADLTFFRNPISLPKQTVSKSASARKRKLRGFSVVGNAYGSARSISRAAKTAAARSREATHQALRR